MLVLSLWLNLSMLIMGLLATLALSVFQLPASVMQDQIFLFGSWSTLGFTEVLALLMLSVAIIIGSVGAAYAYQNGRPATIATFDFAYVAFAMMWGILIFGEELTGRGILGISLVVIAGVLAVRSGRD